MLYFFASPRNGCWNVYCTYNPFTLFCLYVYFYWCVQNFVTSFSAGLYKEYSSKNITVQVGSSFLTRAHFYTVHNYVLRLPWYCSICCGVYIVHCCWVPCDTCWVGNFFAESANLFLLTQQHMHLCIRILCCIYSVWLLFYVAMSMSGIKRTSLMVPDGIGYTWAAVATIGIKRVTYGCFSHTIQVSTSLRKEENHTHVTLIALWQ